jgi:hypothetical protein
MGFAMAGVPSLNLKYHITAVDALTNGLFRLIGATDDGSQLGYGASDVVTGDYVVVWSATYGDIDLYVISNIYSQADSLFIADVAYAETGEPRSGQPESGDQVISRDGFLYSTTFGCSEYLQNGARNLFYKIMDNRVSAIETNFLATAEQVLTNGATIKAFGNVKISTTNDLITLGVPQIETNG